MALTLTEALDNLYTTTWQNMKDTVRDEIFDASPFWFWMKEKNRLKSVAGGRFITEPLQYAKGEVSWIGRGGTVSLNDYEFLTTAKYDWKYQVGNIVRFGTDDQQNRGKNQIINLMNSKFENMKNSLINDLESKLFAAQASGNEIDGLQYLVADDPTAVATPGGVDQNAYTWWRNQTHNLTGSSFATNGITEMRTMVNECMQNLKMDAPDIIVAGQTPYEWYEDENLDYYRTYDRKLADMGFQNLAFKGIPMVWSPSCANTRMYFLNTNYLYFVYDPMMYFDMTEWKAIPDQVNDRAAQIVLAGAFTVSRRRCHGVIYNIDTA